MLEVVEEEEGAESEQEGVVEAAAEERSAPRGIHVSHGWVEGVGDMGFWEEGVPCGGGCSHS